MGGELKLKWRGSYTVEEVKEVGGYIIKDKYSEKMKKEVPIC